jgi:hypothetical protein
VSRPPGGGAADARHLAVIHSCAVPTTLTAARFAPLLLVLLLACGKKEPLCYGGAKGACACGGDWAEKDRTLETCTVESVGGSKGVCCKTKDACECSDAICLEDASGCGCAGTYVHDDDMPKKRQVSTCNRADWGICCLVSTHGGAGRPCFCLNATHCPYPSDEVVDDCSPAIAAVCAPGEESVTACR